MNNVELSSNKFDSMPASNFSLLNSFVGDFNEMRSRGFENAASKLKVEGKGSVQQLNLTVQQGKDIVSFPSAQRETPYSGQTSIDAVANAFKKKVSKSNFETAAFSVDNGLNDKEPLKKKFSAAIEKAEKGRAPTFNTIEQWTGAVSSINWEEGSFEAQVVSSSFDADETAEFSLDEVSEDDREMIKEGALFYWSVGYETAASKQRSVVSTVRFRRGHFWKRSDIEEAEKRADDLFAWMQQE